MSEPLRQSQVNLSAQVEYVDFSEIFSGNTLGQMEQLNKYVNRITLMVVPFKVAYGVTNSLSLKMTIPYISFSFARKDPPLITGSGVGDCRFEGLYRIMRETRDNPSVAVNLCVKTATGTDWNHRGLNEWPIGSGSTDWMITGIFGKKLGPIEGKAVIGYDFQGTFLAGSDVVEPGTALICSLAGVYPSGDLRYGAEVWGNFAPDAKVMRSGGDFMVEKSGLVMITVSPFVAYKASANMTFKAVVDIPVATKAPFDDESDIALRVFRGINVTLGGSWTI